MEINNSLVHNTAKFSDTQRKGDNRTLTNIELGDEQKHSVSFNKFFNNRQITIDGKSIPVNNTDKNVNGYTFEYKGKTFLIGADHQSGKWVITEVNNSDEFFANAKQVMGKEAFKAGTQIQARADSRESITEEQIFFINPRNRADEINKYNEAQKTIEQTEKPNITPVDKKKIGEDNATTAAAGVATQNQSHTDKIAEEKPSVHGNTPEVKTEEKPIVNTDNGKAPEGTNQYATGTIPPKVDPQANVGKKTEDFKNAVKTQNSKDLANKGKIEDASEKKQNQIRTEQKTEADKIKANEQKMKDTTKNAVIGNSTKPALKSPKERTTELNTKGAEEQARLIKGYIFICKKPQGKSVSLNSWLNLKDVKLAPGVEEFLKPEHINYWNENGGPKIG